MLVEAIDKAGYKVGKDVYLGLDVASSEFFKEGKYDLEGERKKLSSAEFVDYLATSSTAIRSSRSRTAAPKTTGKAGHC